MVHRGWNWIQGTVKVSVLGAEPQRFLNICRAKGIFIWELRIEEGTTTFHILASDFKKLRPICKKTGTKVKILKKQGAPFLKKKAKKKRSFLIGVTAAFVLLYGLTFYVWNISVEGNYSYSSQEITDYLYSMEITNGILKSHIDCDAIETAIRNKYNDITWVCAELSGTRLIIHIKENFDTQVAAEEEYPYHLVSKSEAVVTSILTRSGTPLVKIGDTVKKGDILVSGIVSVFNDDGEIIDNILVNADADIYGKTTYTFHDEIPLSYKEKAYTGNVINNYFVMVDNGKLVFQTTETDYQNYDKITSDHWISLLKNFYLPVHYGQERICEYIWVEKQYTEAEAKQEAEARFAQFLENFTKKGIQIVEKNDTIDMIGSNCVIEGTVTVIEPLGKVRPIEQSELPETSTERTTSTNEHN